jgi:sulfite exporter TauE/SafE
MIGTITPVVYRDRKRARWTLAVLLYALGAAMSAAAVGAFLGALGAKLRFLGPDRGGWLLLAGIALLYSLHEMDLALLPRPQRKWQVPSGWRARFHPWHVAFLYGLLLGPGFLTYISVSTYYVVLIGVIGLGTPWASALVLGLYGVSEALGLFIVGWRIRSSDDAYRVGTGLFSHRRLAHQVNGLALALSAAAVAVGCGW